MTKPSFNTLSKLKVLAINGSHRKGNTQFMMQTIMNQINSMSPKHHGIMVDLRSVQINYVSQIDSLEHDPIKCQCCHDDVKWIFPLMEQSNVILLGSPIYFSMVSGRMKTFLDRLNFYWWNKKLKNKKIFTVFSSAGPKTSKVQQSLQEFYQSMQMVNIGMHFMRAEYEDQTKRDPQAIKRLKDVSQLIVSRSL